MFVLKEVQNYIHFQWISHHDLSSGNNMFKMQLPHKDKHKLLNISRYPKIIDISRLQKACPVLQCNAIELIWSNVPI